ncbi:MAG: hypothetical protein V2I33_18360 [Kangiellaceae bacterium]|jgi:hypothetical protein|nr:hypothetical protein [Kangiellaceae bacterium]
MKDKQIKSKTDKVNELTLQIAELRNENVQTTLRERDAAYR